MLPQNVASTTPIKDDLYSPDDRDTSSIVDFELGGIDLLDVSQGMLVRNWKCWFKESAVYLQAEGNETVYTLLENIDIIEIALTFDQSMRWAIAYTEGADIKLNWFNTFLNQRVTTTIENARNPRITLDDKRVTHVDTSDMILGYLRDSSLCYRQQRDRFGVEHVLSDGLPGGARLTSIGLNRSMRLQFGFDNS